MIAHSGSKSTISISWSLRKIYEAGKYLRKPENLRITFRVRDQKIQGLPQRAWVKNIKHIACGSDHTVALSKDGSTVYTWGRREHGQLGRKHKLFVGAPAPSPILSAQSGSQNVEFVLAVGNCSASCAKDGSIIAKAGKCKDIINKSFNAAIISNKIV